MLIETSAKAQSGATPGTQAPVGRFAPSPTGRMHAGNIFAALVCWLLIKSQGGSIVLRIEDLDRQRSKAEFVDAVQRDFEMLGLTWDCGPFFQQDRDEIYQAAFRKLEGMAEGQPGSHLMVQNEARVGGSGDPFAKIPDDSCALIYPCFCSRADLHAASAPHQGEKPVYPGTCRNLSEAERARRAQQRKPAWRLRVPDVELSFQDLIQGTFSQNLARDCGDFILRRSDDIFAYQLAVVLDDAEQGIDTVVRGVDLLDSTPQQIYLQNLLGLPHPQYAHAPLLVAKEGRRLSKRDHDVELDRLLDRFGGPAGVIGYIAGLTGLAPSCEPATPEKLLQGFDAATFADNLADRRQIRWPEYAG